MVAVDFTSRDTGGENLSTNKMQIIKRKRSVNYFTLSLGLSMRWGFCSSEDEPVFWGSKVET